MRRAASCRPPCITVWAFRMQDNFSADYGQDEEVVTSIATRLHVEPEWLMLSRRQLTLAEQQKALEELDLRTIAHPAGM